jgi:hypothetical protein
MLGGGKHAARKLKRAQILLAADAGNSMANILWVRRLKKAGSGSGFLFICFLS